MKRAAPEPVMTIFATPNEVIALGSAITLYLSYLERTGQANERKEVIHLLERFQQRLAQQAVSSSALPSGERLERGTDHRRSSAREGQDDG